MSVFHAIQKIVDENSAAIYNQYNELQPKLNNDDLTLEEDRQLYEHIESKKILTNFCGVTNIEVRNVEDIEAQKAKLRIEALDNKKITLRNVNNFNTSQEDIEKIKKAFLAAELPFELVVPNNIFIDLKYRIGGLFTFYHIRGDTVFYNKVNSTGIDASISNGVITLPEYFKMLWPHAHDNDLYTSKESIQEARIVLPKPNPEELKKIVTIQEAMERIYISNIIDKSTGNWGRCYIHSKYQDLHVNNAYLVADENCFAIIPVGTTSAIDQLLEERKRNDPIFCLDVSVNKGNKCDRYTAVLGHFGDFGCEREKELLKHATDIYHNEPLKVFGNKIVLN